MTRKCKLAAAVVAAAIVLSGWTLARADWPCWSGPQRDKRSTDTGLLKEWPAGGPKLLWKAQGIGSGYSSPTWVDGKIYITGDKGDDLVLTCLDTQGKKLWSKVVGPAFKTSWPGARSSATYDDGKLYLVAGSGLVVCCDAKTGEKVWTRNFSEFAGKKPHWGFAESVLVTGEMAVVTPGGTACMVALNKKTGKNIWQSEKFGAAHYCSAIAVEYKGVSMIINGTAGGLIGVDAKTGKTLWTNDFAAGNTANCPSPMFSDGYLFWAVGYGRGAVCLKLDVADGKVTATEAYRSKDMVCHHGGFVLDGGHVYGDNGGGVSCIELASGKTKWKHPAVGKGSLIWADGMLYLFGEKDGQAALAAASPEGLKITGKIQVAGKGPSWAHPVVTNGSLLLRYDDTLYVYSIKAQ
ncbi:MAG: PQQ-binding-like beta-propeller repeat protein [Planctomycetaceae bacterium]|nr:PQQ-like beta-propeller repeat protein [Planctomycetaceae bacterium]